jgi:hypothetical protein
VEGIRWRPRVYYQRGEVSVDRNFARFGEKSYAINKLTSVQVRDEEKPASSAGAWFIVLALILAMVGLLDGSLAAIVLCLVLAVASGSWGYLALVGSKPRRTYRLVLVSAATEIHAHVTEDRADLLQLRDAIEKAMTDNG